MKLSVFGLGKLGVPMLATLAKNQFKVVGYDINQSIVDSLNKGLTHVEEPGLAELLQKYKANYRASTCPKDVIFHSSAFVRDYLGILEELILTHGLSVDLL